MARLVRLGETDSHSYDLGLKTTIGRSSETTIQVLEEKVSRVHAIIERVGVDWIIHDEGSANGTRINGEKITAHHLVNGDRVTIGRSEFIFVDAPQDPLVGTVMQGYAIIRPLGEGNMGTVYHARQISMQRDVALKLLKPALARDPEYVQRFESEARLAGRLNHANIIRVHDFGSSSGRYFFSMEFIYGENLAETLRRETRLDAERAANAIAQTADGLAHAHQSGIVHQDIKPANIMLDRNRIAKIADLGLAKNITFAEDEPVAGTVFGTPLYMAPELIHRNPATPACDIYALGATFFHLLAGRAPYIGSVPKEILRQHVSDPIPDVRECNPAAPSYLSDLIRAMMDKDPAKRPDATSVASWLRRSPESVDLTTPEMCEAALLPRPASGVFSASTANLPQQPGPRPPSKKESARTRQEVHVQSNPARRMQAKAILYGASVLVAVLIFLAIAWILRPNVVFGPDAATLEHQAADKLERARAAAARDDFAGGLELLGAIVTEYPDSAAATSAKRLQPTWRLHVQINRIIRERREGILLDDEAIDALKSVVDGTDDPFVGDRATKEIAAIRGATATSAVPEETPDTSAAADAAAQAEAAWKTLVAEVGTLRQNDNPAAAGVAIEAFLQRFADASVAAQAQALLADIRQEQIRRFDRDLSAAARLAQEKKFSAARVILEQIINVPDPERRTRTIQLFCDVDRALTQNLLAAQRDTLGACRTLNAWSIRQKVTDLAAQTSGLPTAGALSGLQELGRAVDRYAHVLGTQVARGGVQTGVHGRKGVFILRLGENARLEAVDESGAASAISWNQVPLATIYRLAPETALDDTERAAAVCMAIAREHGGFARSYREAVRPAGLPAALMAELCAREKGRAVLAAFDFSSYRDLDFWIPLTGRLNTTENRLSARTDTLVARLSGYTMPARQAAMRFRLDKPGTGGTLTWSFDTGIAGRVDIAFTERTTRITITPMAEAPVTAQGAAAPAGAAIEIAFDGKAVLVGAEGKTLATANLGEAPANARAMVSITIENRWCGVDNVVFEEKL